MDENIVKLEIGYRKTIQCTVFLNGDHTDEIESVSYKIPQMTGIGRRYKGRPDHITHEQVTDPFGILAVSLVLFLCFGVLEMSEDNRESCILKDIENRDTVFTGRFHTNLSTVIF